LNKEGVAEGSSTMWEVSFDYGPHMSDTVKVKASSEDEAIAKVEAAAEKKGRNIMVNWARPAEQGVAEGVTPASTSKVLRLIDRHNPEWFEDYGMGEVEDTVVELAERGEFQGMSAVDAMALVHQELEKYYGQLREQGVAEQQELDEKWSQKYKSSINCANPRGFSQKAHCAGRNKNEDVAETRRGQVPMTLKAGETDNLEPENIAAFRQLPAYKQGQAAQQKAGKQLIQQSPYTYQSDQDWAYRQGAFDTQQAAMFANFGGTKPLTTAEGEQQKGADYRDPKEVNYDDEYDAMVARVKKLAGLGPMRTVYDPNKRVYRNMPTAQQPKK